jgi:hypothetical protein
MYPFILKLILTFIIGGIWITFATVLAEKWGTKLGGIIGGLPSTIVIGLFFIGWTQTAEVAAEATLIIPFIVGGNCVFVALYGFFVCSGFYRATFLSLLFWAVFAFVSLFVPLTFVLSLLVFVFLFLISYYIMEKKLYLKSVAKKIIHYTPLQLLFRALFSGGILVFAVFIAKVGGPVFGGMFSAFPAVFISTIIISYYAHGAAFSAILMKVMGLLGSFNVVVYAVAVYFFYPTLGIIYGTLVSFLIALLSGYVTYIFAKKKMI